MRTKTMLLTAAMVAAGALSSVAQNVYSVNVVGYINLTLTNGFNLISVPLSASSTDINTVLTNQTPPIPGDGASFLYTWNAGAQTFASAAYADGAGLWWNDSSYDALDTRQILPGQGVFIKVANGPSVTLTLVGTVPQGTNSITETKGYSFIGDPAPVSQDPASNGLSVATSDFIYTWNPQTKGYNPAIYGLSAADGATTYPTWWNDSSFDIQVQFVPTVGQGWVYHNGTPANETWTRVFTVQ